MRHGSLFSGIGGFDLAAEWMGWENVFHCEWNPFGQKVLKHYWPNAKSYHDITETDFSIHRGDIDIITGGFPCQPYSSAGKRLGKEDSRHLWPEMCRAIREISPSWIVGENVRGLTNWNGGMVFDEVCADLENIGYQVTPFLIPACATNAPHKRERIWFIAYSNCNGLNQCDSNNEINASERGKYAQRNIIQSNGNGNATNTNCERHNDKPTRKDCNKEQQICQEKQKDRNRIRTKVSRYSGTTADSENTGLETRTKGQRKEQFRRGNVGTCISNHWQNFPTVSPVCDGDDGLSNRLDSITFPKWRNESIKAGGNAVVPQVVYQIFQAIESFNNQNQIK